MAELVFVETEDLKSQSMMVIVAANAVFPLDLRRGMIPFPQVDARFQFSMTGQAFGIGYFISQLMALRAVR